MHGDPSIKLKRQKIETLGECTVAGCSKEILQRKLCKAHYMKWWRHGDPLFRMPPARGKTPTSESWQAMKRRCNDPKNASYARYGGRGITYDPKWEFYAGFVEDMGERPEGTTIDRIDSNDHYTKDNCRWATPMEQSNNTSANRVIAYNGETMTVSQWARKYDMHPRTLFQRLRAGWGTEKALTTPVRKIKA